MQRKLQKYIDLLIEMAGSDNNYEVIKEELKEVEREIESKKLELKNIKKSMKDDKYLKENDRIIDENIKIGLENKRQVYQVELDKTLKLINKASIDEEDNHQALTSVVSRLKSLNTLLEALQEKIKAVAKDKSLSSFYENMIEETTKEISELEKKKEILTKEYDEVREKLEYYGNNRIELEKKIEHLNVRLEDTLEALSTPNFYVDEILKKKDENVVDDLTKELEELENHRLVLVTDPVYIGNQVMKMFMDDDYTSALASVKELVTIVKAKPYMNESKRELNSLLKQAEITLDEFANSIENNTYLGEDSKIIENRINYLNNELETINNKIEDIKKRIVDIDKNIVQNISKELSETDSLYHNLKDDYEEYKKIVLNTDDTISPRKKANLQAAYNRKKEEMDLVYNLFEKYQTELENIIIQSKNLETVDLVNLENDKENILEEIDELKKAKANRTRTKDILAMEKDKDMLNKISNDVDNIKHSLKYDKSADDIYQEIESLFGNDNDDSIEEEVEDKKEYVNLEDFKIEEDVSPAIDEVKEDNVVVNEPLNPVIDAKNVEPYTEPVVEEKTIESNVEPVVLENSVETNVEPVVDTAQTVEEEPNNYDVLDESNILDNFKPDDKILASADENLEDTKVFPPRGSSEEKYKVINVEEINKENKEEVVVDKPAVVEETVESLGDNLNNTSEYISFNDILNGDGYNGN